MTGAGGSVAHNVMPGSVVLLGIPYDACSSFLRGAALAPARIRQTLRSGASNLCAEDGRDLGAEPRLSDLGDLDLGASEARGPQAVFRQIEVAVDEALERGGYILSLGGDHAVTYPILRAYGRRYRDLTIVHLDAHPDLYDQFEGSRTSHACTFARVMEEGLAARLIQIGVRTKNPHQRRQAERFGVEAFPPEAGPPAEGLQIRGPVYLSLDLDVLDPAFAPGVSHQEAGGLSTRDVIQWIQSIRAPLVGADIVEFNPACDVGGIAAAAAAKLLKEVAACMIRTLGPADGQP